MSSQVEQGIARIRELAAQVAEGLGLELVEVTSFGERRPRICVFVDGPGGVTIDHCATVSRGISAALEEELELLFEGPFRLEVSSPGLDRPFKDLADFRRNTGRRVEVHLAEARPGGVEQLVGVLEEADEQGLKLLLDDGTSARCAFDEVRKVHRSIEF